MLDLLAPPADINNRYVSGRALKRLALSHTGRVRLAADLASGLRQLHPSLAQTARLVGVAEEDIRTELKARAKTHEAAVPTPVTESPGARLAWAWEAASEAERAAAVREIGPAEVWDVLAAVVA